MSELSEVYAVDSSAGIDGEATYQWSNPNTPAPYYQQYGVGTIDQSIFVTQLRKGDIYTFGNYISQSIAHGFKVTANKFGKINNCLCYSTAQPFGIERFGEQIRLIKSGKFSPSPVGYPIDYSQRFYINYNYGNLLLIPHVWGLRYDANMNIDFRYDTTIDDFMNFVSGYAGYLITSLGIAYIKTGPTIHGSGNFRPLFLQFAGDLSDIRYNYTGWGTFLPDDQGTVSGVFLSPASNTLFDFPSWSSDGALTPVYGAPYDLNTLGRQIEVNGTTRMGIPDMNVIITIMDRLGYYWSKNPDSDATQLGARCTDPDVRCPIIDTENGNLITETVLSGSEIAQYSYSHPESNMAWDVGALDGNGKTYAEIRAEYAQPAQPTTEEADEIDLNTPVVATTGGNTLWIMNDTQVKQFFTWLWDPDGNKFDDIVKGCALLGENPMDSIVSLRMYPLQLTTYLQYAQHSICFGRTDSEISNFYVTSSNVIVIDLGGFYFNDSGMFNDFRDYEPYSRYSLYIPFCGIIPLSAIECINTTISIKMIIDLVTGACTAVIYTNKVPYKYLDGMIGIEVPVTGRNMSGYAQTVLGAALGGAGGGLALGSKADKAARAPAQSRLSQYNALNSMSYGGLSESPSSYNAMSDVGKAMGTMSPVLGMATAVGGAVIAGTVAALTNAPAVESKGSNAPAMGIAKPLYPYFIVQRSDCWMPENYAKLYGRPLNEGGKIGDFSGYSEFGNINLDGISGATSAEKTLISELLTSGVYL